MVFPRMKCKFAGMSAAESQLAGAVSEDVLYASTSTSASASKVEASRSV